MLNGILKNNRSRNEFLLSNGVIELEVDLGVDIDHDIELDH